MPLSPEERKLLHQKSKQPTFGVGSPDNETGNEGEISYRQVEGSGLVQYVKNSGEWTAVASSGEMPAVRVIGSGGITSISAGVSLHQALSGLEADDHEQYLLIDGSRAMTGNTSFGADGAGVDVTFYSATSGDNMLWDASEEQLVITGTNAQTSLNVADGNVNIVDNLTVGARVSVSGGNIVYGNGQNAALDVDDVSGTNTVGKSLTILAGAGTGTGAGGDIIFQTANQGGSGGSSVNSHATALTISDDLSAAFAGNVSVGDDLLFTSSGAVINWNSGDVTLTHSANTITVAGGTFAAAAITGTTIDASTDFTIGGTVITDATITDDGNFTIDAVGDIILDANGADISFKDNNTHPLVFTNSSGSWVIDSSTASSTLDLQVRTVSAIKMDESGVIYTARYDTAYGTIITHGATTVAANYQKYKLHVLGDTYFYTQGEGDFEQNYSMISSHEEVATGVTYPGE